MTDDIHITDLTIGEAGHLNARLIDPPSGYVDSRTAANWTATLTTRPDGDIDIVLRGTLLKPGQCTNDECFNG